MKTMKIWRLAFAMLAAFSLASCSSDDEDFDANNLVGTWQKVYDKGVVSEGNVMYGGTPESQTWNIRKLGNSTMSWEMADRPDIIYPAYFIPSAKSL